MLDEITFQEEIMSEIIPELIPLFKEHYNETGAFGGLKVGLNIQWGAYQKLEDYNMLHFITVRIGTKLIGYCVSIIASHLHFADTLIAENDTIFLRKKYRKGLTGSKLIKYVGESLRKKCETIILNLPADKAYIGLANRSGFKLVGYKFRLGDA